MTATTAKLWIARFFACVAFTAFISLLPACNTTEGFGKDVKSAGSAIENKAEEKKHD